MDELDALLGPSGQAVLARIAAAADEPALRLGTSLRADFPSQLVAAAMQQHELRLAGASKFSRADRMLFTRAGLEQASGEPVARHRAARFAGFSRVGDLCCGIGGDLVALGASSSVVGVDRDPVHLRLAAANAAVYGVEASFVQDDVRNIELAGMAAVFVDPARRTTSRRMAPGDSEPPLAWCLDLVERTGAVAIKATPALDHGLVPPGWELELVALGRELKEAVLWSPALASALVRATVITPEETFILTDRGAGPADVRVPGAYLLDPNPAVTRAGLVAELAAELDAWQIDPRIAFLSCDAPLVTPFGRSLRVLDSAPWQHKRLAARLRELDIGSLDIRRRGLAGDVEQIRRRFKLSGSKRASVLMTRVDDEPWALICEDAV